jgi:hypothetical protein
LSQQIKLKQFYRLWKEEDIKLAKERRRRVIEDRHDYLITKEIAHETMMKQVKLEVI